MAMVSQASFVFGRITMVRSGWWWFLIVLRKNKTLRVWGASLQLKLSRRGHGSSPVTSLQDRADEFQEEQAFTATP
jgi:hypothetical protein